MTYILAKIIGIQDMILDIDSQARQCLAMVCVLWSLLTLSAAYSTYLSIKYIISVHSLLAVGMIAVTAGLAVLFVLYALYRRTLCLALFSSNKPTLGIFGCESLICIISAIVWLPNMLRNLVGDLTVGFSLSDLISLNHAGFLFMLLCMALLLIVNIISTYALSISCKRHRLISDTVYRN